MLPSRRAMVKQAYFNKFTSVVNSFFTGDPFNIVILCQTHKLNKYLRALFINQSFANYSRTPPPNIVSNDSHWVPYYSNLRLESPRSVLW